MPTQPSRASLSLVVDRDHHASSDGDLGRALVAGAPWAVRETWHRFAPMVLRMAERSLGSRAEADDIVQEVFHHVFRKAKTLREPDSLRAFVYSFAVRELKSELRRKKVRGWLSFQQPEALAEVSGPALDVESRDLVRACYALLDRLSARDRLVFVLRRVEAMTVEEIAAAMELSPSTVKRSMGHAASRLTRWLDADPELAELLDGGVGRA